MVALYYNIIFMNAIKMTGEIKRTLEITEYLFTIKDNLGLIQSNAFQLLTSRNATYFIFFRVWFSDNL